MRALREFLGDNLAVVADRLPRGSCIVFEHQVVLAIEQRCFGRLELPREPVRRRFAGVDLDANRIVVKHELAIVWHRQGRVGQWGYGLERFALNADGGRVHRGALERACRRASEQDSGHQYRSHSAIVEHAILPGPIRRTLRSALARVSALKIRPGNRSWHVRAQSSAPTKHFRVLVSPTQSACVLLRSAGGNAEWPQSQGNLHEVWRRAPSNRPRESSPALRVAAMARRRTPRWSATPRVMNPHSRAFTTRWRRACTRT